MNPLTITKNIKKLSEQELSRKSKKTWHDQYRSSAWVFVGGLPYDLTEGDIICVFSQYGNPVNINLIRDKDSGKSKGFCFLCYEDQRSTDLAVDNLNSIKILGRTIRVDHVNDYKPPKERENDDDITKKLKRQGCAYEQVRLRSPSPDLIMGDVQINIKTEPKEKKSKKKKKKKKKRKNDSSSSSSDENEPRKKIKIEDAEERLKQLRREERKIQKELEKSRKIKKEILSPERGCDRNPSP